MKVISTGIIIRDLNRFPTNDCIGFQSIGHRVAGTTKWTTDGYLVLQYCHKDDSGHPELLPCANGAPCVWKGIEKKTGQVIAPIPTSPPAHQLSLDELLTAQEAKP